MCIYRSLYIRKKLRKKKKEKKNGGMCEDTPPPSPWLVHWIQPCSDNVEGGSPEEIQAALTPPSWRILVTALWMAEEESPLSLPTPLGA